MASKADIAFEEEHAGDSRTPDLIATWIVCFILAYASVIFRFLARRLARTHLGWDDWLMAASLVLSTAFFSLNIYLTKLGLGRHQVLVTYPQGFVLGFTIAEVLYTVSVGLIKASTLFLWHRLFPGKHFDTMLWITAAIIAAYSLTQFVCVVVQCIPLETLWNPEVKGHCIDLPTVFVVCSSFNVATDLAILVLPITRLWKLQMVTRQKLQLTALFCLGGFVLVISIIRLPQLKEINEVDQSWTLTNSAIWSSLECAIATLSACLPVMRPIYSCVLGRRNNKTSKYAMEGSKGDALSFHKGRDSGSFPRGPANVAIPSWNGTYPNAAVNGKPIGRAEMAPQPGLPLNTMKISRSVDISHTGAQGHFVHPHQQARY